MNYHHFKCHQIDHNLTEIIVLNFFYLRQVIITLVIIVQ